MNQNSINFIAMNLYTGTGKHFKFVIKDTIDSISLKFGTTILKRFLNFLQKQSYIKRIIVLKHNITLLYKICMKQ